MPHCALLIRKNLENLWIEKKETFLFIVSHAVARGAPTAAQLFLDGLLDETAAAYAARARTSVNLAQLIHHCMRKWPSSARLINGLSGASFTNEQMLRMAVPVARALQTRGANGSVAVVVMRNHEQLVAVYYGALLAGVTLCMLEPLSTEFELRHFMELVQPRLVFHDADRREAVVTATVVGEEGPDLVSGDALIAFVEGHSDRLDDFEVSAVPVSVPAVLLPTSGSTGRPKATLITHEGLIAQLPSLWCNESQFPRPTESAMFLSTAQWMTHTNLLMACPVYNITCLIAPRSDPKHALHMLHTYKPTFFLTGPGLAQAVATQGTPTQLASLRTMLLTGSPPAPSTISTLKEKLHPEARVWNGYGMTEAQGFVTLPQPGATPPVSLGKVFNIFDYKFIDDAGNEVSPSEGGELILNGMCIIKGYLGDAEAYRESLTADDWWRTGDVIRQDIDGNLYYVERKKFWFKYQNYQISPEEVEAVVLTLPGVSECMIGATERGAAAAVVLQPGASVTREQIHAIVDATLIEHKRLHGGVAFVSELPRTHSGKLHRRACAQLIVELCASGQCC